MTIESPPNECICKWSSNQHYPEFYLEFVENCPVHACGKMVYQDESRILCCLIKHHDGSCRPKRTPHKFHVTAASRKVERYEPDPYYKEIGRGDGLVYTVPNWVAEILERHADEIE